MPAAKILIVEDEGIEALDLQQRLIKWDILPGYRVFRRRCLIKRKCCRI